MQLKQLDTFFGLAYFISWMIWFPLYSNRLGFNSLPIFPFQHGFGGLGPLIAAFLTTRIYSGKEGAKRLFHKCIRIRPLLYLLIALFAPFLLAFIACLTAYFLDKEPVNLTGLLISKEFPEWNLFTFFSYNLIFFGLGEEVGWRGFALHRLQGRRNALSASLLLSFFWAIWHLPLFFYRPGYTSMDGAGILGWLFSLVTGSILLAWLFNTSRGSILICAIFHSTIDVVFTSALTNENIINYMGFLITMWGLLTIVVFKPKNLSKVKRQQQMLNRGGEGSVFY